MDSPSGHNTKSDLGLPPLGFEDRSSQFPMKFPSISGKHLIGWSIEHVNDGVVSHAIGGGEMTTRRTFLKLGTAVGAGALIRWQLDPTSGFLFNTVRAFASVGTPQTALVGGSIPRFADPLPTFGGRRIGDASIDVGMFEFQQNVLPNALYAALPAPFNAGTYVWGYQVGTAAPSWPGATIEAQRGRATTVTYVNSLPLDPVLRRY